MINSEQASMIIFLLQLILIWISKYSCPALALAAIGGKNKACSGGNVGTTLQNKGCVGSCGNRCKCDDFFWQLISRKWKYEPIRQSKLSVLLCILCKCNCRRSILHYKSATQFAPQGGQWPTSVTHFAKVTYLRPPPTRLFHSPPCADWDSAVIGLSPREAKTWNSLAHALTEFRIGKRILVDDLRSFRRRRSKQAIHSWDIWVTIAYVNVHFPCWLGISTRR